MNTTGALTADQIAIANLAAQFLPKIEPPQDWLKIKPQDLMDQTLVKSLSVATEGIGPDFLKVGWPTPFEAVAEQAVKRARVLLDIAAGKKREAWIAWENGERAKAQIRRQRWERDEALKPKCLKLERAFEKAANGRTGINETKFLEIVFFGSKIRKHHHLKYLRAFQRETGKAVRHKTPPNESIVPIVNYTVDDTIHYGVMLLDFAEANGPRLTKKWQREGNKNGGKAAKKAVGD